MTKPVPVRIRTGPYSSGFGRAKGRGLVGHSWRITGDFIDRTANVLWSWRSWYGVQPVINKAVKSKRSLVITSGKKDKKFWGKVYRRIEKLT